MESAEEKRLEKHIAQTNSIRGYHPIGKIEWTETDLMPNGQYPFNINKKPMFFEPNTFVDPDERPYCFSLIMERDEGQDDIQEVQNTLSSLSFLLMALQPITSCSYGNMRRLLGYSFCRIMALGATMIVLAEEAFWIPSLLKVVSAPLSCSVEIIREFGKATPKSKESCLFATAFITDEIFFVTSIKIHEYHRNYRIKLSGLSVS